MYDIYLRNEVGETTFNTEQVLNVLNSKKGKSVNVLIDSLGGSLAQALSISAAFKEHGSVNVHFRGMNASAATIASLGAKQITIDENAMYLVHKCSMEFFQWASLNADGLKEQIKQMEQMKTDLEKMDLTVARMYSRKCKKSEKELLELMKIGGWMTAQEALQWGFVDSISNQDASEPPASPVNPLYFYIPPTP